MQALIDALIAGALAIIPVAVSIAIFYLRQMANTSEADLEMRNTKRQSDNVAQAADAAGALAYGYVAEHGTTVANDSVRENGIKVGITHMLGSVSESMKALDIDSMGKIESLVRSRLAEKVAADPLVTIVDTPVVADVTNRKEALMNEFRTLLESFDKPGRPIDRPIPPLVAPPPLVATPVSMNQ